MCVYWANCPSLVYWLCGLGRLPSIQYAWLGGLGCLPSTRNIRGLVDWAACPPLLWLFYVFAVSQALVGGVAPAMLPFIIPLVRRKPPASHLQIVK